jgi:lysophospholipase L1-like esterase
MGKAGRAFLAISLVANMGVVYVAYKALEYRGHINFFLEKYTNVVKEFSQRDVWEKANAELGAPRPDKPRVVFLGTQVTARWNLAESFPTYETINRAVPHQRLSGFLLRFRPDVIELHPQAVVIEISSYNLRPESSIKELTDYVATLVDLSKSAGIRPVITTAVPPRAGNTGLGDYDLHDSLKVYNSWIRRFADSAKVPCADFDTALADDDGFMPVELSYEMIDPNPAGMDKMAAVVSDALADIAKIAIP